MMFAVKLLLVPSLDQLSGWDVFELMINARHVAGNYWIFEGDVEALGVEGISIISEGVTEGHGDMNDSQLREHCEDIFNVSLSEALPSYKMRRNRV